MPLTFSLKLEAKSPIEVEEKREKFDSWEANGLKSYSSTTFSCTKFTIISMPF